jgi:predicted Zn-dependent protease
MKKTIAVVLLALLSWPLNLIVAGEIALPEFGDSAGALISPQQEYRIGQSFYWRIQQTTDLIDDPEVNSYLQSLGYRLVSESSSPYLSFTFFMVPASSVNAFAAPGGFIGTHSGLVLASESEDELASVLAHEIAHVTQRHLLRGFEKQKNLSVPMTAATIAAALLTAVDPKAGSAALMAIQAGGVQMQIDNTRAHEKEADNLGMQNLVRAGFDAHAMPSFFERLQKESRFYTGNAVPEFLRTHPVTTNRIAEARGRAATYPLQRQLSDPLQFYLMREKLRVMTSQNVGELSQLYAETLKKGNSRNLTATRYGYSLALSTLGEYTKARNELQVLIDEDHDSLSYQLALAEIEMAVGHLPVALDIYEDNQRLYPDDQALSLMQVKALIKARLPEQAIKILHRQLELGHPSQVLYQQLAQAEGDLGNKSQSHSWLAEYYYSAGRVTQATEQLRLAAKFAERDEYLLAKITARLREVELTLAQMEEI